MSFNVYGRPSFWVSPNGATPGRLEASQREAVGRKRSKEFTVWLMFADEASSKSLSDLIQAGYSKPLTSPDLNFEIHLVSATSYVRNFLCSQDVIQIPIWGVLSHRL